MRLLLSSFALASLLSTGLSGPVPPQPGQDVIKLAGGGNPNGPLPPSFTKKAYELLQIALYLENLESDFFNSGAENITRWGSKGFPKNTQDIFRHVGAVRLP